MRGACFAALFSGDLLPDPWPRLDECAQTMVSRGTPHTSPAFQDLVVQHSVPILSPALGDPMLNPGLYVQRRQDRGWC